MADKRGNRRLGSNPHNAHRSVERGLGLFVARNLQPPKEDDSHALLNQPEVKNLISLGFIKDPRIFVITAEIGAVIIGRQSGGFEASRKIIKTTMDADPKLFIPRMPLPRSSMRKPEVEADISNVVRSFDTQTKVHRVSIRPDGITQGRIYLQSEALMKAGGLTDHLDIQPPEDPLVVMHEGRNRAAAEKSALGLWQMMNRQKADSPDIPLTVVLGSAQVRY